MITLRNTVLSGKKSQLYNFTYFKFKTGQTNLSLEIRTVIFFGGGVVTGRGYEEVFGGVLVMLPFFHFVKVC